MELAQYDYGSALFRRDIICGVELRPFCLGHLILLEESKNPFVNRDPVLLSLRDINKHLFDALLICALTYEEGYEILKDEKKWLAEYNRFQRNLIANMNVEPDWNTYAKRKMFEDYMEFYLDMPHYEVLQKQEGSKSGTDWRTSIKTIFKKLTYTESEILNMNCKQLFQEWTANGEGEGQIKVFNKFTADKLKAAEKMKREQERLKLMEAKQ